MKRATAITLLFLLIMTTSGNAQRPRTNWKRPVMCAALGAISGAAWGTHETISHHWPTFHALHPKANPTFWNPAVSWETTKTMLGYKFDAKHMLASTAQIGCLAGGIAIGLGRKKQWQYGAELFSFALGYVISNALAFR